MQGEWTNLLGVGQEGGNKQFMGLEGLEIFVEISIVREDRSAGSRLHVNGGIVGVFVPKGGVILLVLRNSHNPDDIHKWHAHHKTNSSQNALDLLKHLGDGGSVQGQGGILWLLVIGSPVVFVLLLLSQEVYGSTVINLHKWSASPTNLS